MATKAMSFIEAIKTCFAKYATFKGRARRSEFWWFYLLTCIPSWIMSYMVQLKMAKKAALESQAMEALFDQAKYDAIMAEGSSFDTMFFTVSGICCIILLALFIPLLAAWVRRLHDIGKSGHMLWLFLVCGVGGLIPLFMCIKDSDQGTNQYGESPKYNAV